MAGEWNNAVCKVTTKRNLKKKKASELSSGEDAKHDDFKIKFLYILNC